MVADGREAEDVDPRGLEVHVVKGNAPPAPDPDGLDKPYVAPRLALAEASAPEDRRRC